VIAAVNSGNDIPTANISNLTAAEKHGRELFGDRCAACHTLAASNAVAQVGPNLDELRPNAKLVELTIKNGKSAGNGQMPAGIFQGQDAKDVAAYVAKAVGAESGG
jgi:mono/diheme cytochrome c family protein